MTMDKKPQSLISGDLTLQFMSAHLVSHLSVDEPQQAFNSIHDIEKLGLDLYIRGGTATADAFAM